MNTTNIVMELVLAVIGLIVGVGAGFGIKKSQDSKKVKNAERESQSLIAKAKEQAATSDMQAKNRARNIEQAAKQEADKEARRREQDARDQERRVKDKESQLASQITANEIREKKLKEQEEKIALVETMLRSFSLNRWKEKPVMTPQK
jgi:ribonuclease Y